MGTGHQLSYELNDSVYSKDLLTQYKTFTLLEKSDLVNALTVRYIKLPVMIYGFCFIHMIHQVISLRRHYPNIHIMYFPLVF